MGYLHINNFYKDQRILLFKECYAMEKVHGTSTNISFKNGKLDFYSGGANYQEFLSLFDIPNLTKNFINLGYDNITVYGEAYGGKMQAMKETYGNKLQFIAFEVKINDQWMNVKDAEKIVLKLGLEFVPYVKIPATIDEINKEKEKPSEVAIRRGIKEPKMREGVVLRPIEEFIDINGERVICKHKNDEFRETLKKRIVSSSKQIQLTILHKAEEIANEWVTPMRLNHVLDKFPNASFSDIPKIINAMYEDILREAKGEIAEDMIESKQLKKIIGNKTASMFKNKLKENLNQLA